MQADKDENSIYNILFRTARTYTTWRDKPLEEGIERTLYDLAKWGPTSANATPARYVFVRSLEAKMRLRPHLIPANIDKTMTAPLTVIIGADGLFYNHLPKLYPYVDARAWFVNDADFAARTARDNAMLQAAYFIMATRAFGLDCGPIGGFDAKGIKDTFFAKAPDIDPVLLINIGYGHPESLHPRGPRLTFEETSQIV